MIARLEINLTEKFRSPELVKEVVNAGDRVPITDCDLVQGSVGQYRVAMSYLSFALVRSNSCMVKSLDGYAPFGATLESGV